MFALQIVAGLSYLHFHGVVHKDLKSSNCLVKDRVVKIADFGISKVYDPTDEELAVYRQLTVDTSSPEMHLNSNSVSFPTDIFSLGIILWELHHWKPAWSDASIPKKERDKAISLMIISDKIAEAHPCTHVQFGKLLQDCWNMSPEARPSVDSIHEELQRIIH